MRGSIKNFRLAGVAGASGSGDGEAAIADLAAVVDAAVASAQAEESDGESKR